jgi:hypothetical protein
VRKGPEMREVLQVVRAARAGLAGLSPDGLSGEDCAVLVEELGAMEKVCAVARVRVAARAGECGAHRERGFADVADWMGRAVGSTAGSAKAALVTVAALEQQPAVMAALAAGEVSLAQARELAQTEAVCPGSAGSLLEVARKQGLKALKEEARSCRARAIDPEELHRLQHEAKSVRHWRTSLGTVAGTFELSPEIGMPFINRLEAETDRRSQRAKEGTDGDVTAGSAALGAPVRRAAIAADAFVGMVEAGGKGKAHRADLVMVCDLRAYRRGHAHEGEVCHLVGGGPVPVSVVRALGRDAFLKAVLHDGVKIDTIAHFGRRVPAVLRTALDLGAPPEFDGNTCRAANCDRRFHLQQDHIDPVANGGKTALVNTQPLCWVHHQLKTEEDRRAGHLGPGPRSGHGPP